MRFIAFLKALADQKSDDPDWLRLAAGLVVLREVQPMSRCAPLSNEQGLAAARELVDSIPPGLPDRSILSRVLDGVQSATDDDYNCSAVAQRISGPLSAYGHLLRSRAAWGVAGEVFELAAVVARLAGDTDLELQGLQAVAFSLRSRRLFDEATASYERLGRRAAALSNVRFELEARLGCVKVLANRGNLPLARETIVGIIRDAEIAGSRTVLGKAYIDMGHFAGIAGDHLATIRACYQALRLSDDPRERDGIAINVSLGYRGIGRPDLARSILMVVSESAQELSRRINATIQLLYIAVDDRNAVAVEAYSRRLAKLSLSPVMAAEYYEALGKWALSRQEDAEAREWFAKMRVVCEDNKLHELLFRADTELASIGRGQKRAGEPKPSLTVDSVDVREMERLAELSRILVLPHVGAS